MAGWLPARGFAPLGGPSFHSRMGKAPQKILDTPPMMPASNAWGYLLLGCQFSIAASMMVKDQFVT